MSAIHCNQSFIKKLCCISWLCFIAFEGIAQSKNIDSLRQVLLTTKNKTSFIKASVELSASVNLKSFDENITVASKALAVALKDADTASVGLLYSNMGLAYYFKGKFDSAAHYFFLSIPMLMSTNQMLQLAETYNRTARLYRKLKEHKRAHEFYAKAMNIYKNSGNEEGMATIYNEEGVVYEYEGNFDQAIKNYTISLNIRKHTSDSLGIAYSLSFISGVLVQEKKYKEAENYNLQALQIVENIKDSFSIMYCYADRGAIYAAQKKYAKAVDSYNESIRLAENLNYLELQSANYKELSDIENLQGNYQQSLIFYQHHISLKDSIFHLASSKEIEALSARYETVEKENQIQLQRFQITKRNYWIAGISCLLFFGGIAGFSSYRKYRYKQKARLQQEIFTQQNLATKAVIEAEEKERQRIASDLHDGVGQMMSAAKMNLSAIENAIPFTTKEQKNAYEKAMNLVDESCKEVRTVSHNMMPNALLKAGLGNAVREFLNKIDTQVINISLDTDGLSEHVNANTEIVLYRVIQECVNNVLKHAKASQLDISLIKDDAGISATIEDNGIGFITATIQAGIGLQNIKTRIEYLKGTVEWDSARGNGTLVAIHVPA